MLAKGMTSQLHGLFLGLVMTWQLASPRMRAQRSIVGQTRPKTQSFCKLMSKVISYYNSYILFIKSESLEQAQNQIEKITKGMNTRKQRPVGPVQRLLITTTNIQHFTLEKCSFFFHSFIHQYSLNIYFVPNPGKLGDKTDILMVFLKPTVQCSQN